MQHQNGSLTGYVVETLDSNSQIVQHKEVDANTTHIKITTLEPQTTYVFRVRAKTAGGDGPPTTVQSTTPRGGMGLLLKSHICRHSYTCT